jgi:hypothetical protein
MSTIDSRLQSLLRNSYLNALIKSLKRSGAGIFSTKRSEFCLHGHVGIQNGSYNKQRVFPIHTIHRLVFFMEAQCIPFEVRNESLCIM